MFIHPCLFVVYLLVYKSDQHLVFVHLNWFTCVLLVRAFFFLLYSSVVDYDTTGTSETIT